MPESTPFHKPADASVAHLVRKRIADGLWIIDPVAGFVRNADGQPVTGWDVYGYLQHGFRVGGGRQIKVFAHRVIWEHVNGPIPYPMQVNHINGIKTDNRLVNLETVTPVQNSRHAHQIGLHPSTRGSDHPTSKLNDDQVREILRLLAGGMKVSVCARRFGVSWSTIGEIKQGRTWTHIRLEKL